MKSQCCRLKYHYSDKLKKLALESGEKIFPKLDDNNRVRFDMTNEEDGYPCIYLDENFDCRLHGENKFEGCKRSPSNPEQIKYWKDCKYKFVDGKRIGECDQCLG